MEELQAMKIELENRSRALTQDSDRHAASAAAHAGAAAGLKPLGPIAGIANLTIALHRISSQIDRINNLTSMCNTINAPYVRFKDFLNRDMDASIELSRSLQTLIR